MVGSVLVVDGSDMYVAVRTVCGSKRRDGIAALGISRWCEHRVARGKRKDEPEEVSHRACGPELQNGGMLRSLEGWKW